jgi:aldehyde dehydrogenase (NAD+)
VHGAPLRAVVYTRNEAIGSAGVVAPRESALLGLLSSTLPLLAMGNTVTVVPSDLNPLPACELYRVLEASDFPGGSFNILTGDQKELASVLANHDTVQVLWSFLGAESAEGLEKASVGNLKQTWCPMHKIAWLEAPHPEFLRRAVQVKNIWTPFGS